MKTLPLFSSLRPARFSCLLAVVFHPLSATVIPGTSLAPDAWYEATSKNYTGGIWTDLSGNGNNATQETSSSRPMLVLESTTASSATLRFDGDDFLTLTSPLSSQSWTVFVVLNDNVTGNQNMVSGGLGSFTYRLRSLSQNVVKTNTSNIANSMSAVPAGTYSLVAVSYSDGGEGLADTVIFRGDGTNLEANVSGGLVNTFTAACTTIGASGIGGSNFRGDIAALIIFTKALTTNEMSLVESYLQSSFMPSSSPVPSSVAH